MSPKYILGFFCTQTNSECLRKFSLVCISYLVIILTCGPKFNTGDSLFNVKLHTSCSMSVNVMLLFLVNTVVQFHSHVHLLDCSCNVTACITTCHNHDLLREDTTLRASFSFFQLTNPLANCQLALSGQLSLDAFLNSSVT